MAMFRKKPQGIEAELVDARRKRDRLRERLAAAEAALADALRVRRSVLLEAENDASDDTARKTVGFARDEVDALSDALAEIEERITAIEARLAQARAQAARDAAIAELAPAISELAKAADALQVAGRTVVAALPAVTSRTPLSNANFPKDLGDLFINIGITIDETLARARQQVAQLKSGETRIMRPVEMPPNMPAPPQIARTEVLLVAPSCWAENGEVKSAPAWTLRSLPVDVVARCEPLGWVILRENPHVQRLIETEQINGAWHSPDAADCVDLTRVTTRYGERGDEANQAASAPSGLPPGAVEHVGEARIGTAVASAP